MSNEIMKRVLATLCLFIASVSVACDKPPELTVHVEKMLYASAGCSKYLIHFPEHYKKSRLAFVSKLLEPISGKMNEKAEKIEWSKAGSIMDTKAIDMCLTDEELKTIVLRVAYVGTESLCMELVYIKNLDKYLENENS